MREIVLDTETTGFNPADGDRIVEIGCLELVNHLPTGKSFQAYVNPERTMPAEAFAVHGLGDDFLSDQKVMADVVDDFLEFIAGDPLIIHNADFDMRFLNAELARLGREPLPMSRAVDTVALAREKFPGAQASLDALCRRFEIDNSSRDLHGALLDAQLLAEVYLELIGGRQPDLELARAEAGAGADKPRAHREPRHFAPSEAERAAHAVFLEKLKDPVWNR